MTKNGSCKDIFPWGNRRSPLGFSNRDFFQQNLKRGRKVKKLFVWIERSSLRTSAGTKKYYLFGAVISTQNFSPFHLQGFVLRQDMYAVIFMDPLPALVLDITQIELFC